jgi:hypothetical protein
MISNIITHLERLNIPSSKEVAKFLLFNKYEAIKNINYNTNIQYGSGRVKYIYDKESYIFNISEDKYGINISLINTKGEQDCIMIFIDKETKLASIAQLEYNERCVSDKIKTGSGSLLLNITLAFLRDNKDRYGIKRIILTDLSHKYCYGYKDIKLPIMYFLLYGDTWYGRYGFRPYNKKENKLDKIMNDEYEKNKKIINNCKLGDIPQLFNYINSFYVEMNTEEKKKTNFDMNKLKKYMENNKQIYLSKFLKFFLRYFDRTCGLFEKFYIGLFNKLKMTDFYGVSFYLDI